MLSMKPSLYVKNFYLPTKHFKFYEGLLEMSRLSYQQPREQYYHTRCPTKRQVTQRQIFFPSHARRKSASPKILRHMDEVQIQAEGQYRGTEWVQRKAPPPSSSSLPPPSLGWYWTLLLVSHVPSTSKPLYKHMSLQSIFWAGLSLTGDLVRPLSLTSPALRSSTTNKEGK